MENVINDIFIYIEQLASINLPFRDNWRSQCGYLVRLNIGLTN